MASLRIFSKGWNYSQDGPGNRLVIHLQGCNFHCPWCSNPEGISMKGTLMVHEDKLLDSVCPFGAVSGHKLDRSICSSCTDRVCLGRNRNEGVSWSVAEIDINVLEREILASRSMFYDGGGVTFTGGEATLQFDSLKDLLHSLHDKGVNVALETNGSNPRLPELFECLDLLIMDYKHYDAGVHNQVIGHGQETTEANFRKVSGTALPVWLRIPLIPGVNDGDERIMNFIKVIKGFISDNISVELLKYHEYGKKKWEECGMEYKMPALKINDSDWVRYQELFKENGINIINT